MVTPNLLSKSYVFLISAAVVIVIDENGLGPDCMAGVMVS